MKKVLVLLVALLCFSSAFAEDIDLSSLGFSDLAALRDRCQMEMMTRDEWQEVTIPTGLWRIGEDIPAGHWTFRADPSVQTFLLIAIAYGDVLDANGSITRVESTVFHGHTFSDASPTVDYVLEDGFYLQVIYGPVIVTPFTGKPDLGFK